MRKCRIGNDRRIAWTITRNGQPEDFKGRELTVKLLGPFGRESKIDYTIEGNSVVIKFFGCDQMRLGKYTAVLIENEGKTGMFTVDHEDVFELVRRTADEGGESCSNIQIDDIHLESDISSPQEGMSAYDVACKNGFEGTEQEWLEMMYGKPVGPAFEIKDTDTVIIERDGVRYSSNAADLRLFINDGCTTLIK